MPDLRNLFTGNRAWAAARAAEDPDFFKRLASRHQPRYLWIGCTDARVPANEICGVPPGEMFVHRNVANIVVHSDFNCQAALQFAVDVLEVKHIIVCGHYDCSGVLAAMQRLRVGLADNWLSHLRDVAEKHADLLSELTSATARHNTLSELNVLEQVSKVVQSNVVQDAWQRGQPLKVHGLIYSVGDGQLRDLGITIAGEGELHAQFSRALSEVTVRCRGLGATG